MFACVVIVQLWTPELKKSDLYVATCVNNRGAVGSVPYHFGKWSVLFFMSVRSVYIELTEEKAGFEGVPSISRFSEAFGALVQ